MAKQRIQRLTFVQLVIGSNCARSLALSLATASIGGIFASFATDIGVKVDDASSKSAEVSPFVIGTHRPS